MRDVVALPYELTIADRYVARLLNLTDFGREHGVEAELHRSTITVIGRIHRVEKAKAALKVCFDNLHERYPPRRSWW